MFSFALLSIASNNLAGKTGYVKASKVKGKSKEVGAKVMYQGREMTVSTINLDGDLKMFDLSVVMALAKMIESNTVLRDLKYEAHPHCTATDT